jgi:hypothetical protein
MLFKGLPLIIIGTLLKLLVIVVKLLIPKSIASLFSDCIVFFTSV